MTELQPSSAAESKPEPDLSGQRLGDYQLMRRLARGGMADVYLAEQQSLRRQVAFKVLRRDLARDETYVRRFHNEAQAAAALVHASIVQIYEVGCIDGVHFIAQEYVAGQNLKQLLNRRGPLKLKLAVNIMRQVSAALHRAGSRGIVHRDIKPENIMLSQTGEVKVADFGLARVAGDGQLNLTRVGVTLGTPLYMSPEQVEGRELDPRSDLYSFGVTCYEMLSGQPPFTGDTALSVAVQHLKQDPPRLEDARPDLPGGLCRIVHKTLAKEPAQRYQNAADLMQDLRALRVEGMAEDWSDETGEWDTTEMVELAKARTAATQQLETLMKTESHSLRRQTHLRLWAIGFIAAFALGAFCAWTFRPASLLDIQAGEILRIDRMETPEEQFWYAIELGSEAGFKAVIDNFPPEANPANELYANKARLHLAYYYRENDRLDEAIEFLEQLTAQDADSKLKADALLELANTFALRGATSDATRRLAQLVKQLDDMGRLSGRQRAETMQMLNSSLRAPFERLLEDYPVRPGEGPPKPPGPRPGGDFRS